MKNKKRISRLIPLVCVFAAISIWYMIPANTPVAVLTANAGGECVAQGHYQPAPFEGTEIAPLEENDEPDFLCSMPGHLKPNPIEWGDDEEDGD
jgi:hypothetical protein